MHRTSSANHLRQQLTLFVRDQTEELESIRMRFNPVQYELIAAHVTLCREDELTNLDRIVANIRALPGGGVLKIAFDLVERFEDGKGVWLPGARENESFQQLRREILKGVIDAPRVLRPHITLMHPRNSVCTAPLFEEIVKHRFPTEIVFKTISLIEQRNGGAWKIVAEYPLS